MMKKLFALICLIGFNFISFSQTNTPYKVYEWEEVKNANPDTVYAISFSKLKLETIPDELSRFLKVKELIFKKNKITSVPSYFSDFNELKILDLEKNRLETFPIVLCRMENLTELKLGRNYFETIPECIEGLKVLEYLDLYDNPIGNLPGSFANLSKLKKVDFTGIRFSPSFQNSWIARLPNVELVFDASCECME